MIFQEAKKAALQAAIRSALDNEGNIDCEVYKTAREKGYSKPFIILNVSNALPNGDHRAAAEAAATRWEAMFRATSPPPAVGAAVGTAGGKVGGVINNEDASTKKPAGRAKKRARATQSTTMATRRCGEEEGGQLCPQTKEEEVQKETPGTQGSHPSTGSKICDPSASCSHHHHTNQ